MAKANKQYDPQDDEDRDEPVTEPAEPAEPAEDPAPEPNVDDEGRLQPPSGEPFPGRGPI